MKDIKELRLKINSIDDNIASLYSQRMDVVKDILEYKKENSLAIFDPIREQEVLSKNVSNLSNDTYRPLYKNFLKELMNESKMYQRYLLNEIYDDVIIGENILKDLHNVNLNRKVLIITDSNIPNKYINTIAKQCEEVYVRKFIAGESSKNLENYQNLLFALIDKEFTRKDLIIAIGGGVTTDLAGFVASSYMRGLELINVPTSLLAQVDASVGGKVGIDYLGYKNLVGAFYKANKVIIDVETLKTLDDRLYFEGVSEIIKMALTLDKDFYLYLESLSIEEFKKNITYIVTKAVSLKSKVVLKDEKENDLRRVLNFGHTVGHAIEALAKGKILHGEAVAIGMTYMVNQSLKNRLISLLNKFHLPSTCEYDIKTLIGYIKHDKKMISSSKIAVIRVNEIGSFLIEELTLKELEKMMEER